MRGFGHGNKRQGIWKGQRKPRRRMCVGKIRSRQQTSIMTVYPTSSQLVRTRSKGMKPAEGQSLLIPHIAPDKCVACGMCQDICPVGAITVQDIARVDPNICQGCGLCVNECPQGALSMGARRTVPNNTLESM